MNFFEKLLILVFFATCCFTFVIGQEPEIPSHMPAPPKAEAAAPGGGGGPGGRGPGNEGSVDVGSIVPLPPPQNSDMVGQATPIPPIPAPPPPPPPVIFGLRHIILILVPQFKVKIDHLPKWFGANSKVSLPISIFFDKLKMPDPPFPPPPPPHPPPTPFYGPMFPADHYTSRRKRSMEEIRMSKASSMGANYGNSFGSHFDGGMANEPALNTERVTLIPKLERLLKTFGLEGKSCLLRAICEVHEFPLQHHGYGFLGEVLTLLFSISRSAFAESHLFQYLEAEENGRVGDCTTYFQDCPHSLFYWEKIHDNENTENVTTLLEEEMLLLEQLEFLL